MTKIATRKLDLRKLKLDSGSHSPDGTFCMMEAVAYVAGEPWSDRPGCVSGAIGAFLRSWNDTLNNADRQKLKPYIRKVIGTNTGLADEEGRAWMATDWLVRIFTPEWLNLAGLTEHAAKLRALPDLTSAELSVEAKATIRAAGDAARAAAWDAAWGARVAAEHAARAAAWDALDAARVAAEHAAGVAAWDTAWDALDAGDAARAAWAAAMVVVRGAAGDAAGDATRAALAPTFEKLQASAFDLLDRMIAVGKVAA